MNNPASNPETGTENVLQKLIELLQAGELEAFEIEILKSLATRTRNGVQNEALAFSERVPNHEGELNNPSDTPLNEVSNPVEVNLVSSDTPSAVKAEVITHQNILTTQVLIEKVQTNSINFGIFGTDGRSAGHHTQFMNSGNKEDWRRFAFDSADGIPEKLSHLPHILFVRVKKNFGEYQALTLRVVDHRVDHRGGSHTTVMLFVPKSLERAEFEELAKDTAGLKILMKTILEKADSPLKGAEKNITESFLV